ncbi:hypothetical protein [Caulobacter segnis]|uniref:Uncharacterized protein n=1 Tax=Caulobacter segnis TaxID=88688 RepID=A0A2W5UV30_9CAUL|nr:hypothetical protein [Caulobacter segnis]PZR31560.1 MAG: hypothetical protein DI526_19280 [Caulobacter segnis]
MLTKTLAATAALSMLVGGGSALAQSKSSATAGPKQPIPYSQLNAYMKASPKARASKDWWAGSPTAPTGASTDTSATAPGSSTMSGSTTDSSTMGSSSMGSSTMGSSTSSDTSVNPPVGTGAPSMPSTPPTDGGTQPNGSTLPNPSTPTDPMGASTPPAPPK